MRVLDLSRVLAGPYAGQILAEMGADVIKVESPEGDPSRGIGPHLGTRSLYFSSLNTGKRGIVLDLNRQKDREALDVLLGGAHIVVENFRPDTAAKLGVGAERLLADHPHLTVVTVSGYARTSERAADPALDLSVQAESGIMSVTGEPGGAPVRAGVPVGDLTAGMQAALAAVAGYAAALRDGHGRHIEIPLLDATLSLLSYVATAATATGENPPPVGSGHHSVVPYGAFPTRDGWIAVPVIGDKLWRRLCQALHLDLGEREDLATNPQRAQNRDRVDAAIAAKLVTLTTAEAHERLSSAGVPSAPVHSVLDALSTPYVVGRGLVAEVSSPEGAYTVVRTPLGTGGRLRPAPGLGEHTREVLTEALGKGHSLLNPYPG